MREKYKNKPRASKDLSQTAYGRLDRAIKKGVIQRKPCEVCGDPNSDGHHEDYSQPLKVRWLCRSHHAKLHQDEALEQAG